MMIFTGWMQAKLNKKQAILQLAFVVLLTMILAACSTTGEMEQQESSKIGPENELTQLASEIDSARKSDVHLLSPNLFNTAVEHYNKALSQQKEKDKPSNIIKTILRAKARLAKAKRYASIAEVELKKAFVARMDAISAGVPTLYPREFEIAEEKFQELAKAIEEDDLTKARAEVDNVAKNILSLEILAIKEHKLGDAKKLLDNAEEKGVKKIVPKTFQKAKTLYEETDKYISSNPHGPEVQRRADSALRGAEHLKLAMQQVKAWEKLNLEEIFIGIEEKVARTGVLVSGSDTGLRLQDLNSYFRNIEENIRSRIDSQKFLNEEVAQLQKKVRDMSVAMQDLTEEKRRRQIEQEFEKKFERVRTMFPQIEAEIYRQEDKLLIRLIGLNFEVGRPYIMTEHYPLLSKLQNTIRMFDTKQAIIEGHTDATGSTIVNKTLAQQRADAVKAYLIFNGAINQEKVIAIGYGPDKPIAPNTTTEGRRLNRRIDIVLTVEK